MGCLVELPRSVTLVLGHGFATARWGPTAFVRVLSLQAHGFAVAQAVTFALGPLRHAAQNRTNSALAERMHSLNPSRHAARRCPEEKGMSRVNQSRASGFPTPSHDERVEFQTCKSWLHRRRSLLDLGAWEPTTTITAVDSSASESPCATSLATHPVQTAFLEDAG